MITMKWISVKDRLPTKEDANGFGEVAVWEGVTGLAVATFDKLWPAVEYWASFETPYEQGLV